VFEVDPDFVESIDAIFELIERMLEIVDFDLVQTNLPLQNTTIISPTTLSFLFPLPTPGCRRPVELSEPVSV
jgi:hypothetical protein